MRSQIAAGVVAAALLLAAPAGAAWFETRAVTSSGSGTPPLLPRVPGWEATDVLPDAGGPRFPTADAQTARLYQSPVGAVQFFQAWYAYERNEAKFLYFANRRFNPAQWRLVRDESMHVALGGNALSVREHVLRVPGGHGSRVLWSWYRADARLTASSWHAKLLSLRGVLRGRPDVLVTVLGADADDADAARAQLRAFLTAAAFEP